MQRTIKIVLTERQYDALASATAVAEAEWEDEAPERLLPLNAAWAKINHAWHGDR